jgi:ATP-dependent DNA helicase PIF1
MKSKPEGNNVDGLRETEAVSFIYGSNGRGQSPKTNLQGGLEMKRRRNAQSTQARRMLLEPSFPSHHELISINAEDGYTDSEHRDLASIVSNWKKQLKPNSSTNLEPSPEELKSFKRGKLLKYTLSIQVRLKETLEELKAEKIKVNNFEKSVTYQTRDGAPIVDLTTPPKRKQIEPLQLEQISPRRTEITQETTNTSHSPSRSRSPPPYSITVDSPSSEEWSLMDPRPAFSAPRATPTYNEPPLCEEQSKLVDTIMAGHNVFYTGSAGCGKSTVLRAFVKRLKDEGKRVDIVAPTGRAALDVSGSTTWTYAGWTPNSMKETLATLEKRALGKLVWKRLTETHVLVIDEVSMIENHHFERLNLILKAARDSKKPFGGVQLVVTGDFCQLPPVKPFQHCIQCGKDLRARGPKYTCPDETCPDSSVKASVKFYGPYYDDDKWTFRSAAWKECKFEHRNLTDIHRQSDKVFIAILEKCRLGKPLSQEDIRLLLDHPSETTNAVKLFPTLAEVKRVNYIEFAKLQTPILTFKCFDQFDWNKEHESLKNKHWRAQDGSLEALKDHKFETRIELKKGMLVILLVNLSLQLGLVNGSQGEIIDFVEHTPECLPEQVGEEAEYKKAQINKFIENVSEKVWPVVRFTNGEIRTITPHCWFQEIGDPKPYSRLSRTQIPLIAAWAMSIHKSQGMTLDRVIVDLGRSFEKGQMYVALSRARTLEGLKVVSLNPKHCEGGGNEQVKEFLYEKFGIE